MANNVPRLPKNIRGSLLPISVAMDDITHALARNKGHCPGARAFTRTLADTYGISAKAPKVTSDYVRFTIGEQRWQVPTPPSLAKRVRQFDDLDFMSPFSFKLDLTQALPLPPRPQLSYVRVGKPQVARVPSRPGAKNGRRSGH